jgi:hypothetical protein
MSDILWRSEFSPLSVGYMLSIHQLLWRCVYFLHLEDLPVFPRTFPVLFTVIIMGPSLRNSGPCTDYIWQFDWTDPIWGPKWSDLVRHLAQEEKRKVTHPYPPNTSELVSRWLVIIVASAR